jgi:hypothetical protein
MLLLGGVYPKLFLPKGMFEKSTRVIDLLNQFLAVISTPPLNWGRPIFDYAIIFCL